MAGQKLSAKTEEEIVFMEHMLLQCDGLTRKVEEYANCKTKAADGMTQPIVRHLSQFRQQAMQKNLGPLADAAGTLSILCGRGSQMQRSRVMREGLINFKVLIERMMKAAVDADVRARAEAERVMLGEKAVARAKAQDATPEGGH
ncbi:MAG TPA: hypothetical protein VGI92_04620 [Gemmatimonadales bacterium]|jgi:hypothetical protein